MVYNGRRETSDRQELGLELAPESTATSDLIRDEQIKVIGCRFANPHVYAILNDVPLRYFCESIIVVTPAVKQHGAKRNVV